MDEIVKVEDLHKAFLDKKVLNGLSLMVKKGETVSIVGKSGSGKTLLLKMIVGLERPDKGKVYLFGREIFKIKRSELLKLRERVGFVFQSSALFDSMNVFENVAYPFIKKGLLDSEKAESVKEIIGLVGLEGFEGHLPQELSGGMRKRVAIARALITHPELILYDEPTAGLDPATSNTIAQIIKDLAHKSHVTSVIVTHDLDLALDLSDRVLFLRDGVIKEEFGREDFQKISKSYFD